MYTISPFIRHYAVALLSGAALATLWVNLAPELYLDMVELRIFDLPLPDWVRPLSPSVTPLSLVSGLLMPLFFFFVGKELWEALVLERGALQLSRQPLLPLGALVGSAVGAVAVWLIATALLDPAGDAGMRAGWASGIGSDVVLCYVIGRAVFGRSHPALHFLLLLCVVQDIVALFAVAASLRLEGAHMSWALLSPAAALWVWYFFSRNHQRGDATEVQHQRAAALWPYALAGAVSWLGFALAGFPPELGLLPVIPFIPHALHSFGIFAEAESLLHDPLNRLVAHLNLPIMAALFAFGLTRGAIDLSAFGPGTKAMLATLWIGKPLGFLLAISLALTFGGAKLPPGLRLTDFVLLAVITSTGFVVPLIVLDLGLDGGITAAEARLGVAISLVAGPICVLAAHLIRRQSFR